jgi:protein-disulfide isomerase
MLMSPEKISKRQQRREKILRQSQRQRLITIALIAVGAALVVFAVIWPQLRPIGEIVPVTPAALPDPNGLSLGDPDATVVIEVFEDFQCIACQRFSQNTEPLIVQNIVANGKTRYVFRNYPFIDGEGARNGGESDQASNATMCANEQGKFWEMKSIIYANWTGVNQGSLSDRRLQAMAESLGLDMKTFNDCFSTNRYVSDIQADFERGTELGVSGTPSVFVNGIPVGQPGRVPSYQEIAQAVEDALNASE